MTTNQASAGEGLQLPKGLADFRRFLRVVGNIEISIAIAALVVVVVLSAAQTLLRYLYGTSLWWSQEVSEIAILSSYFFGISYVFKTRQYILIEFIVSTLPLRLQLACYIVAQVLTVLFAAALVWLFYLFLPTLFSMRTTVMGWPAWILPAPIAVSSVMIIVTSSYYFLFGLWAFRQPLDAENIDDIELRAIISSPLVEAE